MRVVKKGISLPAWEKPHGCFTKNLVATLDVDFFPPCPGVDVIVVCLAVCLFV